MSREDKKQIEEMAKTLGIAFQLAGTTRFGEVAEVLYNTGYRKSTEVAEEIFWEVDKLLTRIITDDEDGTQFIGVDMQKYYALKKKYTEGSNGS